MTSNYVIVQTKLWLDVGNDKHFPLCNSGGCIMSGLEVIEGGPEASPPNDRRKLQKPPLILVSNFSINPFSTRRDLSNIIERRYDDSVSMSSLARHVPSVGSFPEPLKEPEMIDLDNFAFDQESLNESIHEMAFTFGADEEYQPNAANKQEDRKDGVSYGNTTYAVVMKPKAKAKEDIVDVTV